jgi:hypothetical protein
MKFAPIVLFTYNRPKHTKQTIEALQKNEYAAASDLIVYSDAPGSEGAVEGVEQTRLYLKSISGFKSVVLIEREENFGLANNIIDGVTDVINRYGRIIVLEDDLLTSPYFLTYMNEAMNMYENDNEVISVSGYVYPLKKKLPESFFIRNADCLGWGTWQRGWELFVKDGRRLLEEIKKNQLEKDFDFSGSYPFTGMLERQVNGRIGSWAIRWYASAFLKNKLTLYPGRSLIFHNGSDGSGTNCGASSEYDVELSETPIHLERIDTKENIDARKAFIYYFRYTSLSRKIKSLLKRIIRLR